ncbi:MAG: TIGR00730 family Rossman fold protein [Alphaproteobacteria bacterium]|nr:TIGR00730 family Rossman fold protein [Alphaproteobacteria bacterium]
MNRITAVSVYCGAAEGVDPAYRAAAADFGRILGEQKIRLVYGGELSGMLGLISAACRQAGGEVTGIITGVLQDRQKGPNDSLSDLHIVADMGIRKQMMMEKAEGVVVLPGGFGTLDEVFDVLSGKYIGLHDKPVVFANIRGFYAPLLAAVDHMVETGFTPAWHRDLYRVVEDVEDILPALEAQRKD